MPTVKGNLLFVSSRAAQVSEVWVRAPRVRTHVEGVVTTGNDRFPVDGGEVSFTAVPGPAVLALISQGRAVDTIPILVGDAGTQTLRQVVSAAMVADDATKREIEKLAAQAVQLVDSSVANAKKAQDGATRAETAASRAKTSETNAASSASDATFYANAASSSASKAATSEQNAAKSATSAKQDADKVANTLDNTFWQGDRLAVNGMISPPLTGPKGDPGEVSKAQLDVAIEAVKATINRAKPVYFTTDDGSTWYVVGGTPAGWNIWTAGRIYPPAGKYWVEMSDGATVEHRPTQVGVPMKQASLVTIADGSLLLAMYTKPGHTIKITPIT